MHISMNTARALAGAAALAAILATATPGFAFFDKITSALSGEEEKPAGKNIDSFKPAENYDSVRKQRQAGLALARSSGYGILPPSPLTAYVNDVLKKIVKVSPVPDLDVQAVVIPEQGTIAEAKPDGLIFVGWEFLIQMKEEDELATVLAHELSHILYRNHDADWLQKTQKTAAQAIALVDQYKGALGKGTGDSTTGILVSLGVEVTERIIAPNLWSRDQEVEADRLGIDLVVKAGYNPLSANGPLSALDAWQAKIRKEAAERQKAQAAARDKEAEAAANSGNLGTALKGVFGAAKSAMGKATDAVMDGLGGDDHPPTEKRIEDLNGYIERLYADADGVETRPVLWLNEKHASATILNHYRQAWKGMNLIKDDPRQAERYIRRGASGPTVNDTFPRYAFAMLRESIGARKLYVRNLEMALKGKEPGFVAYQLLIRHMVEQRRTKDALALMEDANRRLGEPPHLVPYRIALLVDSRKKVEAMALHGCCKVEFAEMSRSCDTELKGLKVMATTDAEAEEKPGLAERAIGHQVKKKQMAK